MIYTQQIVNLKISKNIIKGSLPTDRTIQVQITVMTPQLIEVENIPIGLDSWTLD